MLFFTKEVKIFCSHCGKEIDDSAVICVHCGVATQRLSVVLDGVVIKKVNGFGVAGLVVGLLSLWFGALVCVPSIVGLVLSIIGAVKKKNYNSANGLAIAGIVLSAISLFMWLLWWIIMISTGALWQINFN